VAPTPLWPMVKANAYGHGMLIVARVLVEEGVKGLGVATAEEALSLREGGITRVRVIVFGGDYGDGHGVVLRAGVTPVVHRASDVEAFSAAARRIGAGPARLHVEVDTGMSRLGVRPAELRGMLAALEAAEDVVLEG